MNNFVSMSLRLAIGIIVFLTVLSISFLVEAADIPSSGVIDVVAVADAHPQVAVVAWRDGVDGLASWYGPGFHSRRTASGTRFDQNEMTAAHKSLPFGTLVRVTNANTGASVIVEITDRGPFLRHRVIDLSMAAAKHIGVSVTPVELDVITPADMAATLGAEYVMLIGTDGTLRRLPRSDVTIMRTYKSYAEAYRAARNADDVAVIASEEGKPQFALVEVSLPMPVMAPQFAALDTITFDAQ
jgi:rare lipoprotein A